MMFNLIPIKYVSGFHLDSVRAVRVACSPHLYPEWPHRQGGCLACCVCTFESRRGCTDLYYARGAQGVLPMSVGGATS